MWSTITLASELLLTVAILYIFYTGYTKGTFLSKIALPAVLYETFVNIVYMVSRSTETNSEIATGAVKHSSAYVALAIFHGIFSLVMFISLVIFLFTAWQEYKKGNNFFRIHKKLTVSFIALWLISVASGVAFYFVIYFFKG